MSEWRWIKAFRRGVLYSRRPKRLDEVYCSAVVQAYDCHEDQALPPVQRIWATKLEGISLDGNVCLDFQVKETDMLMRDAEEERCVRSYPLLHP